MDENKNTKGQDKSNVEKNANSDIFITEDDTFDITVFYYKENDKLIVKSVDDSFDDKKDCQKITVTFKYPSQGDVNSVQTSARSTVRNEDGVNTLNDFMYLEFTRLLVLIRKWTLKEKINNETILTINPKIIRAMINGMRDVLGGDGII